MGLPEQDQPPEHMWLDAEAIGEHFDTVRARYQERSGGTGADDDFSQNDYTKGLRR